MTLRLEQWIDIPHAVKCNNSNESDILEKIKEELKKLDENTYQEWEEKRFNVNHRFSCGRNHDYTSTLLHSAASWSYLDMVKCLIEKGANVNAEDESGKTPLHYAVNRDHLDTVKYLVEQEASVDAKDESGKTPLHCAAERGHLEIVKYLVENGADVNVKDNEGKSIFCVAVTRSDLNMIRYLAQKVSRADLENDFKNDRTLAANINSLIEKEKKQRAEKISDKILQITAVLLLIAPLLVAVAVGIGCGVAGVGLPVLAIAGIAIAAGVAAVVAVPAVGIVTAVIVKEVLSKPSNKLDEVDLNSIVEQLTI